MPIKYLTTIFLLGATYQITSTYLMLHVQHLYEISLKKEAPLFHAVLCIFNINIPRMKTIKSRLILQLILSSNFRFSPTINLKSFIANWTRVLFSLYFILWDVLIKSVKWEFYENKYKDYYWDYKSSYSTSISWHKQRSRKCRHSSGKDRHAKD